MAPKLSIVIGTFNQKDTLKEVLSSLTKQTAQKEEFEIIVVDSSSTDGTDKMVAEQNVPNLIYIRQENLGRPGARNRGIKEAKGEIILLTDADMVADERLVEEHILCHENNLNVAAEGLTYNLRHLDNYTSPDNLTPYIHLGLNPNQHLHWMFFLSGNLSVKKHILLEAGLFDPIFTGYGWEDVELGYRVTKYGTRLIYLPSAINYHFHLVGDEEMEKRSYNKGLSAAKFYKKHKKREIKYFLGMNPLAMAAFRLIESAPLLRKLIEQGAKRGNGFSKTLLNEYIYRRGFLEGLKT